MIKNPIVAFQNPTTDQGRVTVKSTRKAMAPKLYGGTATVASHSIAAMVAPTRTANNARRRAITVVAGLLTVAENAVTRSSIAVAVPPAFLLRSGYTREAVTKSKAKRKSA